MLWCGPPGSIGLEWRNLFEVMLSVALAVSLPKSPKDMCGGTPMECGDIPAAALLWLLVMKFMPKLPGWKKEFWALV